DYSKAKAAYKRASVVANELHDVELVAAVRTREGIISMRQDQPLQAIDILKEAHQLIYRHGFPLLRGNILGVLSEAYAKAHQGKQCWETIDMAESLLQQPGQKRERSHRLFSAAVVQAHRGTSALLLHDYNRALVLMDKSLRTY